MVYQIDQFGPGEITKHTGTFHLGEQPAITIGIEGCGRWLEQGGQWGTDVMVKTVRRNMYLKT